MVRELYFNTFVIKNVIFRTKYDSLMRKKKESEKHWKIDPTNGNFHPGKL